MATLQITPGKWYPLGAECAAGGVNFALYSANATGVELLLFNAADAPPSAVMALPARTRNVWHGFVAGVSAGQLYGLRVQGPYVPERGLRFNPHKLLIDPWARALSGKCRNTGGQLLAYDPTSHGRDLTLDTSDNTAAMPKAIVIDDAFDWQGDAPPNLPFEKLVIYEVHVKGFTAHASSGVKHPGTYLGFIEKIPHLRALGINAVELLPVHEHVDDDFLAERGRSNYWGYNTLAFFAPESSYGTQTQPGCEVREFKTLVRELHRAGIEVILDVVFNHTAEGSERGPTLSLRGIDNTSYYMLCGPAEAPGRYYTNLSGCGNTLDATQGATLRLIMDSLRYWAEVMHVDGFRFDLAPALAREGGGFDPGCAFLRTLRQDPVLANVKLIVEPWDLALCVSGSFPPGMAEWNDRYRDAVRGFWLTGDTRCGEFASRLAGSSDMFRHSGRMPQSSINFVTAHDGFTLADLVSYAAKHNEANGEGNADGNNNNRSVNCGTEGDSTDAAVLERRGRLQRALLATIFLSQGVPMLVAGDEQGRSQNGNNNAYCQDNAISWIHWDRTDTVLRDFTARLVRLRRAHPALHRTTWFDASPVVLDQHDIAWLWRDGHEMTREHWENSANRCFGFLLGRNLETESALLVLLNAGDTDVPFLLPPPPREDWKLLLDTTRPESALNGAMTSGSGPVIVPFHGLLVLASAPGSR